MAGTTDVPDGGAYSTSEHLRAQREQLDKDGHPLPTLGAGEQAKPTEPAKNDEPTEPTGE